MDAAIAHIEGVSRGGQTTVVYQSMVQARQEILLHASIAYGLFGIYLVIFLLAMWTLHLTKDNSQITVHKRIRWTLGITAVLILFRQVLCTVAIWRTCLWSFTGDPISHDDSERVVPVNHAKNGCGEEYYSMNLRWISMAAALYIAPLVAILSDGILAWRVYVVWNRPPEHFYFLVVVIGIIAASGLLMLSTELYYLAVSGSVDMIAYLNHDLQINSVVASNASDFSGWVICIWLLNTFLSLGIFTRIKSISTITNDSPSRSVTTIMRALVEAALLSWFGTLSCAVTWIIESNTYTDSSSSSISTSRQWDGESYVPSKNFVLPFLGAGRSSNPFAAAVNVALPYILAISQVLIVTRVNILKFSNNEKFVKTLTGLPEQWSMPPDRTNDDPQSQDSDV